MTDLTDNYCDPDLRAWVKAEAERELATLGEADWPLLFFPRDPDEEGGVAFNVKRDDTYEGLNFIAYSKCAGYLDCADPVKIAGKRYTTGAFRRAILHARLDAWLDKVQSREMAT